MRFIALALCVTILCCTKTSPDSTEPEAIAKTKPTQKPAKPAKKLVIGGLMADQISEVKTGHVLYVRDEQGAGSRLFCTSFTGQFSVSKISSAEFNFIGTSYFPQDGNWGIPFQKHEIFSFTLSLQDTGWTILNIDFPKLLPSPDYDRLDSIKTLIDAEPKCVMRDWEVANDCFPLLKHYEFLLFSAALNNDRNKLEDYIALRDNFSITNAGEFSEYYQGNVYLLVGKGIIKPEDLPEYPDGRFSWLRVVYPYP